MVDPELPATPGASRAATWRRYLRFWGPRADADVDDELSFHIEMRTREYVACGIPEPEARRRANRRLGNLASARAECIAITSRRERRMSRAQIIDALVFDVKFAWRTLGRQTGWTIVAAATLALGIGANTAVFSVVNTLLLHPVPYANADRIAMVSLQPTGRNRPAGGMRVLASPTATIVRVWREGARSFEALEPYTTSDQVLRGSDGSLSMVHTAFVLPSFAAFTGSRPVAGRMFTDADMAEGSRVLVLSEPFWRARLGGDPTVIGRALWVDGRPGTVIGIMPAGYRLPRLGEPLSDVWAPLDLREPGRLRVVARLRPNVSFSVASRELDMVAASELTGAQGNSFGSLLIAPAEMVNVRDSLVLLSWAVGLVLLIACGNVAHLLLARTAARQRELAIRAALGATRLRIVRQMLTESLLLSMIGLVGGVLVGWFALRGLVALRPDGLAALADVRIDRATLLVTAILAVLTGLSVGSLGAVNAARQSAIAAFKASAMGASQSWRQRHFRSLLVVSEMAVSTTLLVGAVLITRSVLHLHAIDRGFDPRDLYSVTFTLPNGPYGTPQARRTFAEGMADRVRALPGVRGVTIAAAAPPSRSALRGTVQVEGTPVPEPNGGTLYSANSVSRNFFQVMGLRLIEGTTPPDTLPQARQVLVNSSFATHHWSGQSAIGKRFRVVYDGAEDWMTIVGVVPDASVTGLINDATAPFFYLPITNLGEPTLIVRATSGAEPIAAIRALVTQADASLPPPRVSNIAMAMDADVAGPRFTAALLVAFTILAVILAAVGLYGVMAYAVAQRTREIGIRVALGATRPGIARAVLQQGLGLTLAGALLGLIGARWGTKLLEHMLYGVQRSDATSFLVGAVVLVAIATVACMVPMRRAVLVDPIVAIRTD